MKKFTYYRQCLNCEHRNVCKFSPFFKEYCNIAEYGDDVSHRPINFKLIELYKVSFSDEILETPFLFAYTDCSQFRKEVRDEKAC